MKKRRHVRRLLALVLALCLLPLAGCGGGEIDAVPATGAREPYEGLEVTVFDAGKADAILLTTPSSAVLIDCGKKDFGRTILDELAARGIERIDVLILSHFDKDHVGGAAKLLGSVEVDRVLQNGFPGSSSEYRKYLRVLAEAGIEPETVRETVSFTLDGVVYTVEPPQRERYDSDESNNASLIVTAEHGDNRLVFMGDAQTARIAEYLSASPPPCGFLKVPHHGQKEKLMDALLAALRPQYAVITCSAAEPEAASTAELLAAAGAETFLTRLGAVRILSDGVTLTAEYIDR